jgi:DNA replication protein DnaC
MLIHPTVERLRALGLSAMADAFIEMQNAPEAAELTREDWLGLLVDREATSRENKRLARRLRAAKLRQAAVVEDVNLHAPRGLDRALFQRLATCEWVRDHHHLVVVGPTGIGKSWLACASATRRAVRASRCSTNAPAACLATSARHAARATCRAC